MAIAVLSFAMTSSTTKRAAAVSFTSPKNEILPFFLPLGVGLHYMFLGLLMGLMEGLLYISFNVPISFYVGPIRYLLCEGLQRRLIFKVKHDHIAMFVKFFSFAVQGLKNSSGPHMVEHSHLERSIHQWLNGTYILG